MAWALDHSSPLNTFGQGLLLGDMPALYPKKHTSSVLTTLGQCELLKADSPPSVYPHCLAQPECSEIERRNKLLVLSHKVPW